MHIAILCPFSHGPTRGNLTTVNRITRYLQKCGCRISLLPLDDMDLQHRIQALDADPPELLHAFHAYHAGPLARKLAQKLNIPYLITITGSDLFDPALRDHRLTVQSISDAAAVICFDQLVARQAQDAFGLHPKRLFIIPQSVEPFEQDVPKAERSPSDFVILLPAALRPVKGIDDAITQLLPLTTDYPQLQLWIAGGPLDRHYADQVAQMAAGQQWIRLLGEIPYLQMGSYYQAADLVLNSSWFEGGMANALLEAMASGRPVLARNIPGNRSLIHDGKTGWLYHSGEELRSIISAFAEQPDQLLSVGRAAQVFVTRTYSPEQESASLQSLYVNTINQNQRT